MLILLTALAAAAEAPPAIAPSKDQDPVVCRRGESVVGTHMKPKKTCLRKSEWELLEDRSKRQLQTIQDRWTSPGDAGDRGGSQ